MYRINDYRRANHKLNKVLTTTGTYLYSVILKYSHEKISSQRRGTSMLACSMQCLDNGPNKANKANKANHTAGLSA